MSLNRRRVVPLLVAAVALTGLSAACKSTPMAGPPTPSAPMSSPVAATPTAPAVAATPTCAEIRNARVRGLIDPYYSFGPDGATMTDGMFSDKDGLVLAVQTPCATGNLGGEIGNVTVGAIMSSIVNTTGRFWGVMLCTNGEAGRPDCVVHFTLDDRDPIESVSVDDQKLTLVYLTRPEGGPSAAVSIRRTAVFVNTGTILREESRVDTPFTP